MKIYTTTGDDGHTALCRGPRVPKSHVRVEACGSIDELNCLLGLARAEGLPQDIQAVIDRLQAELFELGAELALPGAADPPGPSIDRCHVAAIEADIDRYTRGLEPLRLFIIPGGGRAAAALHLARAVCRRAERRAVALGQTHGERIGEHSVAYLNRLGDLLFVLARAANARAGIPERFWPPNR